jgi:hypothetical protein
MTINLCVQTNISGLSRFRPYRNPECGRDVGGNADVVILRRQDMI